MTLGKVSSAQIREQDIWPSPTGIPPRGSTNNAGFRIVNAEPIKATSLYSVHLEASRYVHCAVLRSRRAPAGQCHLLWPFVWVLSGFARLLVVQYTSRDVCTAVPFYQAVGQMKWHSSARGLHRMNRMRCSESRKPSRKVSQHRGLETGLAEESGS